MSISLCMYILVFKRDISGFFLKLLGENVFVLETRWPYIRKGKCLNNEF